MKTSSSSRGRSVSQNTQSAKTTKPTITNKQPLQNINLNINIDVKKTIPKKQMPPKPPSKIEYNVEVNMTQSKIIEAKQGLQLLKRKMNRTGMSRQKNHSQSQKIDENFTKTHSNANLKQNYTSQQNSQQKKAIIPRSQKQLPTTSNKEAEKIIERPVLREINEFQDERPISHNNNFMALLQKQMKKQENLVRKPLTKVQIKKSNKIVDDNGAEIMLHQCSKGCGRMFNPQIISKHEKICEKVFQSKRKEFNSAVHRQVEAKDYNPLTNITKNDPKVQKKKSQIPKWKLQSAAFRAGLKMGKNQKLTKQQQKMMQMTQQDLVSCQFCGRKFNELASKKHIPFCEKKSKQSKILAKKR